MDRVEAESALGVALRVPEDANLYSDGRRGGHTTLVVQYNDIRSAILPEFELTLTFDADGRLEGGRGKMHHGFEERFFVLDFR